MRPSGGSSHRASRTTLPYAGLGLALLLAAESACSAGAPGWEAAGSTALRPSAEDSSRRCNPSPHATIEDMRLAVAVLQDTTQIASWGNVAWYLGELGLPGSFEALRNFIWDSHEHADTLHVMLGAITSAQASIGHIVGSNPRALDYLIRSTNPTFWKSLPWKDPRRTAPETWLEMSKASIRGLGISGTSEARQMLGRLRQWPYDEAQRATIEEAIKRSHHVSLRRRWAPADLRPLVRVHVTEILPATTDSSLLFGTWRWMKSNGSGYAYAPPSCGWSRTLDVRPDMTYSLWEEDSARVYPICSGRFTLHSSPKGHWVEFEGWSWDGPGTIWPLIMGPDLLALRPGGTRGPWYGHLGLTHVFARGQTRTSSFDRTATKRLPPRVRRLLFSAFVPGGSYSIDVPPPFRRLSSGILRRRHKLRHWGLVPEDYEYTHYQIPTGVIGDFDGDSLADVAIYGYSEERRNVVTCLLSSRGSPRAVVAWTERGSGDRNRATRPWHYLELCRSGQSFVDSTGKRLVLATDAICFIGKEGERSMIYLENGVFRRRAILRS